MPADREDHHVEREAEQQVAKPRAGDDESVLPKAAQVSREQRHNRQLRDRHVVIRVGVRERRDEKRGNCTDFHALIIGAARSQGIPARFAIERGEFVPFFQPLIDQGLTGAGTNIIQTFKDVNDEAFADDPYVKLYQETLTAQGLDPKQTTYATAAPGRAAASPARSSRACSAVSSGRSVSRRRQRASGRRRSAPRPVHGASTSTRSAEPSGTTPAVASAVSTVTGRPAVACPLPVPASHATRWWRGSEAAQSNSASG